MVALNYSILEAICSPKDLQHFSYEQLQLLATEIRQKMAEVIQTNGGHLGPNLGMVEVTLACHLVFDFQLDRFVLDVGHQCYPHKILTERYRQFSTLRKKGGISGYPNSAESNYDVFRGGHASTAISTSLGIREAFNKNPILRLHKVVALVGDGAMTGGVAYEALNHAGGIISPIIILLNDNSMSISPTVGALSNGLNRIRSHKWVEGFATELINFAKKMPKIGEQIEDFAKYVSRTTKNIICPMQIFTNLGFDYVGPVNGHDIKELRTSLESIRDVTIPTVVHILTEKGREYFPDGKFGGSTVGPHALSPKNPIPSSPKRKTWSKCFSECLMEIAKEDSQVVAITAAMPEGTMLDIFAKEFPNRYYDVGICEQHATGFASGLSYGGAKPVFAVYSTFLQRAFDQIFHEIVLQNNVRVVFCIDRAGLVGDDGPSHHGVYDIAYMGLFPKSILMSPKDGEEFRKMFRWSLLETEHFGPIAIRYPKGELPSIKFSIGENSSKLQLGVPEKIIEGKDVAILAYGSCVETAWQAVQKLNSTEVTPSLYNVRFAKPLDLFSYQEIAKSHKYIVTIEEGVLYGGYGSFVRNLLQEESVIIRSIGVPDRLIEHASREDQLQECGLHVEGILKFLREKIFRQ